MGGFDYAGCKQAVIHLLGVPLAAFGSIEERTVDRHGLYREAENRAKPFQLLKRREGNPLVQQPNTNLSALIACAQRV